MSTRIVVEMPALIVNIYVNGQPVVWAPRAPTGEPWASYDEAYAWALQRAGEGIAELGWPPLTE